MNRVYLISLLLLASQATALRKTKAIKQDGSGIGGEGASCAPGCHYSSWLGDGYCDVDCYVEECEFDKGDCESQCAPGCGDGFIGDGTCDGDCLNQECDYDGGDCDFGLGDGIADWNAAGGVELKPDEWNEETGICTKHTAWICNHYDESKDDRMCYMLDTEANVWTRLPSAEFSSFEEVAEVPDWVNTGGDGCWTETWPYYTGPDGSYMYDYHNQLWFIRTERDEGLIWQETQEWDDIPAWVWDISGYDKKKHEEGFWAGGDPWNGEGEYIDGDGAGYGEGDGEGGEGASCAPGCHFESWLGDGICDEDCNVEVCEFDRGDCKGDEYASFLSKLY